MTSIAMTCLAFFLVALLCYNLLAKKAAKESLLKLNLINIETENRSPCKFKAYSSLLQPISHLYPSMHVQQVEPELTLIYEISKAAKSPKVSVSEKKALDTYTRKAQKAIIKVDGNVSLHVLAVGT